MFKFASITVCCFFTVLAVAAATPTLVTPLAYSAPLTYAASPAAAVVGNAAYIAPFASTYNAHHIGHSAAFPAAYAAAPIVPAAHAGYVAAPVVSASYTPFAAPVLLKK